MNININIAGQEEVFLNQFSKDLRERRLAFIDKNKDLWLCPVLRPKSKGAGPAKHKLQTQVKGLVHMDAR